LVETGALQEGAASAPTVSARVNDPDVSSLFSIPINRGPRYGYRNRILVTEYRFVRFTEDAVMRLTSNGDSDYNLRNNNIVTFYAHPVLERNKIVYYYSILSY
jgi:hypothetical protein